MASKTALQWSDARIFLFLDRNIVRVIPKNTYLDPRAFPGVWALVDSNAGLVQPRGELVDSHSKFFVIQATSPQPIRWKAWMKHLSAQFAVMRPWSWEEIYIGGLVHTVQLLFSSPTYQLVAASVGPNSNHQLLMVRPCDRCS